ncbi:hypothetical protein ACFFKU_12305 [Kineococcus gynurae]|uniref:Uncharacterized protein n=1 Tax=Kineococcus gynurae TaxID=452979 RepID=A0ABV5LQW5_9ACTN
MSSLPCDPDTLATELSRPLVPSDRHRLTVERLDLLPGGDVDSGLLVLHVRAAADPAAATERWQVRLPLSPSMLDPRMAHDAFVLTLRANLEEWWMTRNHDPRTAAWARRVSPPTP